MKRWACWILVVFAAACGSRLKQVNVDSQTHWLQPCSSDAQCGEFSCLCGVCSMQCDSTADCVSGQCTQIDAAIGGDACTLPASERVCAAECRGDGCSKETAAVKPSGIRSSEALAVPECPLLTPTTSLPILFLSTEIVRYEGWATVNQRTDSNVVVLVLNDSVGELLELRFNAPMPDFLPLGRRVQVDLQSGGSGSARFRLLVLRDDAGSLLLVSHTGRDTLVQDGLFATAHALGFSLELTMTCQSAESDGCFEDQVQATYAGLLKADDEVITDGSSSSRLTIEGTPFDVRFWSTSVDGGRRLPDCHPDITAGRYLELSLIRQLPSAESNLGR